MKFKKAMEIINSVVGYMVSYEKKNGSILCSGCFPDKHAGEALIKTESEAWVLASKFAAKTKGVYLNIYVVDSSFKPVSGYEKRKIINR